jgi:hypothetical protein
MSGCGIDHISALEELRCIVRKDGRDAGIDVF